MKPTIITPKVQSLFSKENIGKLFGAGFEKLKNHDEEDSDFYKLRNLKGIVDNREVWIIEDAQAVTLLLPEEY